MGPPLAGAVLGSYEIVAPLGSGGMGDVYRAVDKRLKRQVAIKVLPARVADDPDRLRRFDAEARAVAALSHPNILAVFDVGMFQNSPYIVTELLEGETLRQKIAAGPLPLRRIAEWGIACAHGLAEAHARGITHRDIKPENLFITKDGRLKIVDFGLAKQAATKTGLDETTKALETSPGTVMGTTAYMSPEQVRGELVDHRSDLFSLGCVLYEMTTGRRPFEGASMADMMSAILREHPREVSTANPALDRIVMRCLEKNRDARFQSAADLAFALEAVATTSTAALISAAPSAVRRDRSLFVAALCVLIAVIPAAFWLGRSQNRSGVAGYRRETFRTGSIGRVRFAPDGHTVVYSAAWRGEKDGVYAARLGSTALRRLDLPPDVRLAAVSSTGEMALLKGSTLSRAPLDGTAPREVANNIEDADWSPDGSELAVIRRAADGYRIEYPLGKKIMAADWAAELRVSPDGEHIAILRAIGGEDVLSVVDRRGRIVDLVRLLSSMRDQFCWSPNGHEIWYTEASAGGAVFDTLNAVTLSGNIRRLQQFAGGSVNVDAANRDGRLLLRLHHRTSELMTGAFDRQTERDLAWLDTPSLNDVSADGSTVLFSDLGQSANKRFGVYIRHTDGSPAIRLSDGLGLALSPDMQWAAAESMSNASVLVPTGPGEEHVIRVPGLAPDAEVRAFLPGGAGYIVIGKENGKRYRVYAYYPGTHQVRAISPEGSAGGDIYVSPDGSDIAVASQGRASIYSVSGGNPRTVALDKPDQVAGWTADGRSLFVLHRNETQFTIERVEVSNAKAHAVRELNIPEGYSVDRLRVASQGGRFVYERSSSVSELYLAEGIR